MPIRPNFLIIGAMKCGTTSLYELFRQHPEIGMSTEKEPAFFAADDAFARGWGWYESLFAPVADRPARGEASTSYSKRFRFPRAADRIARHLPDVKLIYVVRDPLERIESQWMHGVHQGWHDGRFERGLEDPGLVDPSRYWAQISAYRRYFADEQMLVLFFDDFKADPRRFLERCFQFIGVNSSFVPEGLCQRRNTSETHQSDAPVLKALRRLPTFSTAVRVLPEHWRAAIRRRWFTRGACGRPAWSEDLRRKVLWQISDDIRTFLYFYGKPLDHWDLGESDTAESFSLASQPALPIRSPLGFLPLPQSPDAMSLG
ncbi:MAG TPA: sulfotransferase domain-containing protein [Pirellulales bacterium]|nr:sulfotransferase domain-containing protein [Pirellulales bacterium]